MCLIIFIPNIETAVIRKTVLRRGFEGNPHGCGFSYLENGKIKLQKGYFTFDGFYKAYSKVREHVKSGPFLIHFRYATRGVHNRTNSQPIFVNKNLVMAHNGTFDELRIFNENLSDSVTLAKNLRNMGISLPFNRAWRDVLTALCTDKPGLNKLVFFDVKGKWEILNPLFGMWREGCWYSDKGECLKKEIYNGYYISKLWKKCQHFPKMGRPFGSKSKNKIEQENDFTKYDSPLKTTQRKIQKHISWKYAPLKEKKQPATVKQSQSAFPPKRPFGSPSAIFTPTIFPRIPSFYSVD